MSAQNKSDLLEKVTYNEFETLVLETGIFKDEILSDYIRDIKASDLFSYTEGNIQIPTVEAILKENGEMYFEMLQMYYNG